MQEHNDQDFRDQIKEDPKEEWNRAKLGGPLKCHKVLFFLSVNLSRSPEWIRTHSKCLLCFYRQYSYVIALAGKQSKGCIMWAMGDLTFLSFPLHCCISILGKKSLPHHQELYIYVESCVETRRERHVGCVIRFEKSEYF